MKRPAKCRPFFVALSQAMDLGVGGSGFGRAAVRRAGAADPSIRASRPDSGARPPASLVAAPARRPAAARVRSQDFGLRGRSNPSSRTTRSVTGRYRLEAPSLARSAGEGWGGVGAFPGKPQKQEQKHPTPQSLVRDFGLSLPAIGKKNAAHKGPRHRTSCGRRRPRPLSTSGWSTSRSGSAAPAGRAAARSPAPWPGRRRRRRPT